VVWTQTDYYQIAALPSPRSNLLWNKPLGY
jgi:hypothetical protein